MRFCGCLFFVVCILLFPQPVFAGDEMLPDLSALEEAVTSLESAMDQNFPLQEWFNSFREGDFSIDLASLLDGLIQIFFGEMRSFAYLLGQILLLGILAAVLHVFSDSFHSEGASQMGKYVISLAFLLIAVKNFHLALDVGSESIKSASDFLYALLPVLLGSFAFTGGTVAATVVQPSILMILTIFMGLLERFFLPLLMIMAALVICSHLSSRYSFRKFYELIRSVILVSLGFLMMIFTGVLGLSGITAATVDGIGAKSLKMAAGNFIPVVGGYISDAFDSILGAGLILRSGIGIFGVIIVALVVIVPALRILVMAFLFKLGSAVLQPFGEEELTSSLSDFSSVLTLLFGLVAVTGLLFFFLILCIVAVSTATMMFR